MSKEMISVPEGNLLRVASTKSITTLSALKEKTSVDRKTLRAINAGQPVKKATLQSIADKLRVPIEHLLASNAADKTDVSGGDDYQFGEIKLQRLDATALRKLADDAHHITWFLNVDQMPDELEIALKKLKSALYGRFWHANIGGPDDPDDDNLGDAIDYVKTSADIDKVVEVLASLKLKIFGSTYVFWNKTQPSKDNKPLPILSYFSELRAALKITPEDKTNPAVRVGIGRVPPRQFVESELKGIDFVKVDRTQVWVRENNFDDDMEESRVNPNRQGTV